MRLRHWLATVVAAVACAPQSRSLSATASESRLVGCYELRAGPWERDAALNHFYSTSRIPRRIRLDTVQLGPREAPAGGLRPYYAVEAIPPAWSSDSPFTYWRRLPAGRDSISIGTPMALGGAAMRLALEGGVLRGTLTTFTDVVFPNQPSQATVPIILEPLACPSP